MQLNIISVNLFAPNAPFPYPLKTSKNPKVFWCFPEVEKGCIGKKWVNLFHATGLFFYAFWKHQKNKEKKKREQWLKIC